MAPWTLREISVAAGISALLEKAARATGKDQTELINNSIKTFLTREMYDLRWIGPNPIELMAFRRRPGCSQRELVSVSAASGHYLMINTDIIRVKILNKRWDLRSWLQLDDEECNRLMSQAIGLLCSVWLATEAVAGDQVQVRDPSEVQGVEMTLW